MDFWETLYTAADNAGVPTTKIGPKLGLSRGYIAACKAQGVTPGLVNAARLLGACGYVLAALPADQLPDGALVIDGGAAGPGDGAGD